MSEAKTYRKKPVTVQAIQWTGDNFREVFNFAGYQAQRHLLQVNDALHIPTLEGKMIASPGDYVIRGVLGELYPCKPNIFAKTYEPEPPDAAPDAPTDPTPTSDSEEVEIRKNEDGEEVIVNG